MRVLAPASIAAHLFYLLPRTQATQSRYQGPHLVDASPPFAYLEPETVAQATRFARHLIDKRRHVRDLTAR
jgi:hypothetical protein